MRVHFGVLLAVVCGVLSIGAAQANAALDPCKRASTSSRSCATLTVPLDRSGAVPGTVKLRIERQKAKRAVRPPLFLLAGGPGESAIEAFDSETVEGIVGTEARSRDVVVMDLRGTGRSGRLECPGVDLLATKPNDVAACAARIGARRDFYSSIDHADDIDAVRVALGAERIALYAVSRGTYTAQVYARRYSDRVDRLALDSVVGPEGVDAFQRSTMAATPEAVASGCGRRCRRFLPDPGATVTWIAARIERRPVKGYVVDRQGRRRPAQIDALGLLDFLVAYPAIGGDLPALLAALARGDSAPLLKAQALQRSLLAIGEELKGYSDGAAVASLCSDSQLPWSAATPVDARRSAAAAAAGVLPSDAFSPFGRRTALANRLLELCLGWPSSQRLKPVLGPLPDVPALVLAGGAAADTPVSDARAVVTLLPRAELMVVPGTGSDLLAESDSGCVGRGLRRFLAGGVAGRCGRMLGDSAGALPPPPTSLHDLRPRGAKGRPGRTVAAVQMTAVEAFRGLLIASLLAFAEEEGNVAKGFMPRVGALRAGSYEGTARGFVLRRASHVPGVRVDGRVRMSLKRPRVRASFRITGRAAARGRLRLRGGALAGTVGGRAIRVRFGLLERALGFRSARSSVLGSMSNRAGSSLHFQPWWRTS
jgi:pimeloyl-ACP methyl ester carboxylesterase